MRGSGKQALIAAVAFLALFYGADYLSIKYAIPARRQQFATVHVEQYLAIREKFNKIAYERTDPLEERCVNALFPHFGSRPCWYVKRHPMRFIAVG